MTSFYKLWSLWEGDGETAATAQPARETPAKRADPYRMTNGDPSVTVRNYMQAQNRAWTELETAISNAVALCVKTIADTREFDHKKGRAALPGTMGTDDKAIGYEPIKNLAIPTTSRQRAGRLGAISDLEKQIAAQKAQIDAADQPQTKAESVRDLIRLSNRFQRHLLEAEEVEAHIGANYSVTRNALQTLQSSLNQALRKYQGEIEQLNVGLQNSLTGMGSDYVKGSGAAGRIESLEGEVDRLTDLYAEEKGKFELLNTKVTRLMERLQPYIDAAKQAGRQVADITGAVEEILQIVQSKTGDAAEALKRAERAGQQVTRLKDLGRLNDQLVAKLKEDIGDLGNNNSELVELFKKLRDAADMMRERLMGYGIYVAKEQPKPEAPAADDGDEGEEEVQGAAPPGGKAPTRRKPRGKGKDVQQEAFMAESFDIAGYLRKIHRKNKIKHHDGDW